MSLFTSTTTLSSLSSQITSALGIDGWQLKDGKYNGCSFLAFAPIPYLEGSMLYQSGTDAVAMYHSFDVTATGLSDPNSSTQLYETKLGVLQFTDNMIQGKVVKKTPYTNEVNIEDTGFQGYEFGMSLVFIGDDYVKALSNFENRILTPPENPDQYLSLVHPVRGKINGLTYVTDFRVVTSLIYWNGCIVNVTFRATSTSGAITKQPVLSTAQQISRSVNTALKLVNGIGSAISNISGTVKNYSNGGLFSAFSWNNELVRYSKIRSGNLIENKTQSFLTLTEYQNIVTATNIVQNSLLNCVAYVCRYGDVNIKVAQISALEIDYNYLPKVLNQIKEYVLVQADIIMTYYYQQIDNVNKLILEYGIGADANDLTIRLNQSAAILNSVCQSIGNKITTKSFIVPYDMSIQRVLSLNNLPLNKLDSVMNLNPQILSSNYIPANSVMNLI